MDTCNIYTDALDTIIKHRHSTLPTSSFNIINIVAVNLTSIIFIVVSTYHNHPHLQQHSVFILAEACHVLCARTRSS